MKKVTLLLIVLIASAYALKAQSVNEYTASNGVVYKVNQTLVIGIPAGGHDEFQSIQDVLSTMILGENKGGHVGLSGMEMPIKKIKIKKRHGQRKPFVSIGRNLVVDLESGIRLGEIL